MNTAQARRLVALTVSCAKSASDGSPDTPFPSPFGGY
jgi:hypothetical protein